MLLIDTRTPPPEPSRGGGHWVLAAITWALPWPALVVWLLAAATMCDGRVGVAFAWAAVAIAFWRMSRAYPGVGGLRDYVE
jgi:hypothetical protein